jgi:hypothetical protein
VKINPNYRSTPGKNIFPMIEVDDRGPFTTIPEPLLTIAEQGNPDNWAVRLTATEAGAILSLLGSWSDDIGVKMRCLAR